MGFWKKLHIWCQIRFHWNCFRDPVMIKKDWLANLFTHLKCDLASYNNSLQLLIAMKVSAIFVSVLVLGQNQNFRPLTAVLKNMAVSSILLNMITYPVTLLKALIFPSRISNTKSSNPCHETLDWHAWLENWKRSMSWEGMQCTHRLLMKVILNFKSPFFFTFLFKFLNFFCHSSFHFIFFLHFLKMFYFQNFLAFFIIISILFHLWVFVHSPCLFYAHVIL